MKRFSRRLLLGIAAIAFGTIVWHIAHGYWVGWKQVPTRASRSSSCPWFWRV